MRYSVSLPLSYFYPRPPGGGRPLALRADIFCSFISIHALRVEGDISYLASPGGSQDFYPRPPGGGRRVRDTEIGQSFIISIHALRVEGDLLPGLPGVRMCPISIHALRVEGDNNSFSATAGSY